MNSFIHVMPRRCPEFSAAAFFMLMLSGNVSANTLDVAPEGASYKTPCAAFAAAADGDTIQIGAGTYVGDVCGINKSHLTIRGVGIGRPKIDANGASSQGKGIWVAGGTGTVIENVEMFGARVADKNGAAIRLDGRDLAPWNDADGQIAPGERRG